MSRLESVGIWSPSSEGLRRNSSDPLIRSFWADEEWLGVRRGRRARVVLLGESVGRGFFVDPVVTPAKQLSRILDHTLGDGEVDVVDLCRTDLDLAGLVALAMASARTLRPDFAVIWAGNNWHVGVHPAGKDLERMRHAQVNEQWQLYRQIYLDDVLAPRVSIACEQVTAALTAVGCRAIWLYPEFNIADWRDEPSTTTPLGAKGNTLNRWEELRAEGENALRREEWNKLGAVADELDSIAHELSPLPLWYKGRCALQQGMAFQARDWLERARDCLVGLPVPSSPRGTKRILKHLTTCVSGAAGDVIEVSKILTRREPILPNRRLFYDYCHMTPEGLGEVVRYLAAAISGQSNLTHNQSQVEDLEKGARGRAAFLAALHNAHYGQGPDIVKHWIREAAKCSDVKKTMVSYLGARKGRGPLWMQASMRSMLADRQIGRYLVPASDRRLQKFAEPFFEEGVEEVIGPLPRHVGRVRLEFDLTRPEHWATSFRAVQAFALADPPAYVRSRLREQPFRFMSDKKGAAWTVRLTLRCVSGQRRRRVKCWVNGVESASWLVGDRWQTVSCEMTGVEGRNVVTIQWPRQVAARGKAQSPGRHRGSSDVLPCWGEIWSFRIAALHN